MFVKLYKGDCLERMKEIPNDSVDLILADLPYGTTDRSGKSGSSFKWTQLFRLSLYGNSIRGFLNEMVQLY